METFIHTLVPILANIHVLYPQFKLTCGFETDDAGIGTPEYDFVLYDLPKLTTAEAMDRDGEEVAPSNDVVEMTPIEDEPDSQASVPEITLGALTMVEFSEVEPGEEEEIIPLALDGTFSLPVEAQGEAEEGTETPAGVEENTDQEAPAWANESTLAAAETAPLEEKTGTTSETGLGSSESTSAEEMPETGAPTVDAEELAPMKEEPELPLEVRLFASASAAEKSKHYQQAYDTYAQALELLPEYGAAWMGKGRCSAHLSTVENQRLDEAAACFKQAMQYGQAQPDELTTAADLLGQAVVKHTKSLVPFLTQQLRHEIPTPPLWVVGKARQKAEDIFSDRLSERFWDNKLPLFNSLWFAWWGLSKDTRIANAVYDVIKALRNSALAINYQEAFVKTLDPIVADIKITLPRYRPPYKIKFETTEDEEGEETQTYTFDSSASSFDQTVAKDAAFPAGDASIEAGIAPEETTPLETNAKNEIPQSDTTVPLMEVTVSVDEPAVLQSLLPDEAQALISTHVPAEMDTKPVALLNSQDAAALQERKLYREALAAYTLLAEVEPENASLWMAKGRCAGWASSANFQQLDEAVLSYKKGLELGTFDTEMLSSVAADLSSATLAYTQDLAIFVTEAVRQSMPAPPAARIVRRARMICRP